MGQKTRWSDGLWHWWKGTNIDAQIMTMKGDEKTVVFLTRWIRIGGLKKVEEAMGQELLSIIPH